MKIPVVSSLALYRRCLRSLKVFEDSGQRWYYKNWGKGHFTAHTDCKDPEDIVYLLKKGENMRLWVLKKYNKDDVDPCQNIAFPPAHDESIFLIYAILDPFEKSYGFQLEGSFPRSQYFLQNPSNVNLFSNRDFSRAAAKSLATETTSSTLPEKISINVGILGASGYTGAELTRLLRHHPYTNIKLLTSERFAGQAYSDVYPQFHNAKDLPKLTKLSEMNSKDWENIDAIFCALPHATSQEIIASLPEQIKVIDLSADFRLKDYREYEKWYNTKHKARSLQSKAVYGLPEIVRNQIKKARLVANPGCYPTAAQLALIPLLREGLIFNADIIIDAKSGTAGAGRSPKQSTLYCEIAEGFHPYGIANHRHIPEIEQGLKAAAETDVKINFTPHLVPMSRGILETIYVKMHMGASYKTLRNCLIKKYEKEPFVHVLDNDKVPETRHVRGTNHCIMNVFEDRIRGRAIIVSAIDNLVKGASGQAIQNFNIMFGLPETTSLLQDAMFP